MNLPKDFKKWIQILLIIPTILLVFGIYHGLLQVLYRAGWIQNTSFFGIEYYQGLTLHGVINALVFTTIFEVAFGYVVFYYYLKKEFKTFWLKVSALTMLVGTILAAFPMFKGTASVLYTFYPPLKASPLFYLGATLLVVGSWIAYFHWLPYYLEWRKENPQKKTPIAVLGMLVTFTIWFVSTIPLAVEVLVLILPWSLGWVKTVDVSLARTLFWFFGHPLVYFWLLPSYVMFYVMLPKISGGKLFSDAAARMAFIAFLILSAPIGIHHQFGDPGIRASYKWFQASLTFLVAIPSFITAFTLAASMEHGAKQNGGRGFFHWWTKLPFFSTQKWLFAYFISGLFLFLFGGITGIINSSATMNHVVHNTSWIPGHFHTTVGGPVFLSFIAMIIYLLAQFKNIEIPYPRLNLAVPYLWFTGVMIFSIGLSVAGVLGQPRRTNLGMTYSNASNEVFTPAWQIWSIIGAIGGIIMFLSMAFYFVIFFKILFTKAKGEGYVTLPESEALHDEDVPWLQNLEPWVYVMIAIIVMAYTPPLYDLVMTKGKRDVPGFSTDNPKPQK